MKINNLQIIALLAAMSTAGTAFGVEDSYSQYTQDGKVAQFGEYGVTHKNEDGHVTLEVTDGKNLSDFDMFYYGQTSAAKEDDGVLMGGAYDPILHKKYDDNKEVKSVTINIKGGEGLKYILGMGYKSANVTGDIEINVSGGDHGTIMGGVHYPSGVQPMAPGNGSFAKQSAKNNVTIKVTGGEVEQIRAGNSNNPTHDIRDYIVANGSDKDNRPYALGGNATVIIDGGTVGTASNEDAIIAVGSGHSINGNVEVEVKSGAVIGNIIAGGRNTYSMIGGDTSVTISGGKVDGTIYAGGTIDSRKYAADDPPAPTVNGSTSVTMSAGEVTGSIYGAGDHDVVDESTKIEITGGTVGKSVYGAGNGSIVKKDVEVSLTGGTVGGNVYGAGEDSVVGENVVVTINGADVTGNVYAAGKNSTVKGNSTVKLLSGNVGGVLSALGEGSTVEGDAGAVIEIGTAEQAYVGSVGSIVGFDQMVVSKGSRVKMTNANLFDTLEHTYTLSEANLKEAAVTLGSQSSVSVNATAPVTLNFAAAGPLKSGRYKVIDATAADVDTRNWNKQNVLVNGVDGFSATFDNLKWVGNVLYFIIKGQDVTNAMAANWGVFKSSQAFVNTLWGNRTNSVVIKPVYDGKNSIMPTGKTVAWGTVYGQGARISGIGADYKLFGASVGAEHTFATGRSIGAAFGYDWGTVSPFSCSDIDQESIHLALYGRAGAWKAGQNGTIVLDWSAAYGNTTSETDAVNGDWDQNNIQLDARVSYLRQLRERTMGSVFAGLQYFAAEDSSVDGIGISSMQNVRAEVGVGVSHKATPKTTVYGEVSVYNDVMRHNPNAVVDGHTFYGTNPGRIGGTITAGAEYRLNEDWSLRGSYNFEVADDSVEHNINAGAIYKF